MEKGREWEKGKERGKEKGGREENRGKVLPVPSEKQQEGEMGRRQRFSLKGTFAFAYSLGTSCPTQRGDMLCKIYKGQGQGVPGYQQAGYREGIHVLRLRLKSGY